jgi:eukaryotic-like serine/threonine-protein kinase
MQPRFRFDALAKIASGGTASVYVGAGPGGELVALKRPHAHVLEDRRQRATLLREAELASSLHHPCIARVREVETAGEELQLVMDYVEGAALGTLIADEARADGRLPPRVAVRIVLDACAGLEAVHEQRDPAGRALGLVHRDVSPQNILVGTDGVARLSDFGIAKAVYEGAPSTTQGTLKGKLGYMAPEYVRRGAIDRAVDIFAMGVVLWESLAGRRLFRGENEAETLDRVLRDEPPPLAEVAPELAPFDAVVAGAVAKDPGARFPAASSLAAALEGAAPAIGGAASHAEVGAYVAQAAGAELASRRAAIAAARPARSRRLARGAAIAGVGLAAAVGLVAVVSRGRPGTAPAPARSASLTAEAPPAPASADPNASAGEPASSGDPTSVAPVTPTTSASSARASTPSPARAPAQTPTRGRTPPPNPYVHRPPTR